MKHFWKLFAESLAQAKGAALPAIAGSLAFTTILSIVPLIAVLFYVFKLFGGFEYGYERLLPFILNNLAEGTGETVSTHIQTFIQQVHAKAVGWAGVAGLVMTSVSTYLTISSAFNRLWQTRKLPPIHERAARALTLMVLAPILMSISIAVTTAVAARLKSIPYSSQAFALLLNFILFSMIYALVPMVKIPLRVIAKGALLPAVLFEVAKYGYAIYTAKFVKYSAFYGSFAALPLFLVWIYIAWMITLYGAVWVKVLQTYEVEK